MPSVIQMLRGILPAQRRRVTLHGLVMIRLCTLQREFCSRCNLKLLHPLKSNGISRGVSDVMLMYLLNERNQLG
jgi:hypothetical protein